MQARLLYSKRMNAKVNTNMFTHVDFQTVLSGSALQIEQASSSGILREAWHHHLQHRRKDYLDRLRFEANQVKFRLLDLLRRKHTRTFVFASVEDNEGSSFLVMSLAKAIEDTESLRVLAVDADFAGTGFSQYLDERAHRLGLHEVLSGLITLEKSLLVSSSGRISFLGRGAKDQSPVVPETRLLHGNPTTESIGAKANTTNAHALTMVDRQNARDLVRGLESRFGAVLMEASPLARSSSAWQWAAAAGGIIPVIQRHRATKAKLAFIKQIAHERGVEILGYVINTRKETPSASILEWQTKTKGRSGGAVLALRPNGQALKHDDEYAPLPQAA